ncbi:MAG: response regulator transcription factor [Desulfobacterota bacterium]|nr:response regulator transcription factor [Thermodesulfobacteriota bacterium]
MEVLLIEDEEKLLDFMKKGLEEEGYAVDVALDGKSGLELILKKNYDIILLDLMIPEIDGLELLRIVRAQGVDTPVLIITARTSKEDIVRGLDLGSDDYLTKPFSFDELLARMRALLRRSKSKDSRIMEYKELKLDPYTRKLMVSSKDVDLTEKEFMILEYMFRHRERPLTREEIGAYVWGGKIDSTNIVDVYVNFLRKKMEKLSKKRYIQTIRGTGYILKDEN